MKRTSYIFNLNREVSLIDLDWILTDECGKGNWEASIDMAEGDCLWLDYTDEDGAKWRALGKEKTFDRAYVVIEYEEWDDPRSFIDAVKANIQERIDDANEPIEPVKPAEPAEEDKEVEEIEILDFYNSVNAEIEATEFSQDIIYFDEDEEIESATLDYCSNDSDGVSIEEFNLWRQLLWMNTKKNIAEARVGNITTQT